MKNAIPNAKVRMSNQIQNSDEMPKSLDPELNSGPVRHNHNVILNSFQNPVLNFDIHLIPLEREILTIDILGAGE